MRILFVALVCALSGCATDDLESDAFFNRGWLRPKDLDEAPPKASTDDASRGMEPSQRRPAGW